MRSCSRAPRAGLALRTPAPKPSWRRRSPRERAVPDVGAVLHAVEADDADHTIRGALRLAQRVAERGDVEHAAAVHDDPTAPERRAGMKDRHVGMALRRYAVQPLDDIAAPR